LVPAEDTIESLTN